MFQVRDDNWLYYNEEGRGQVTRVPEVVTHYDREKYENTCELVVIHALGKMGGIHMAHELAQNPKFDVSWHLTIDREGLIYQLLDFKVCAFHAGTSNWKHWSRLNLYSIGIELECHGLLDPVQPRRGFYAAQETRLLVPQSQVQVVNDEPWQVYTQAQLGTLIEVLKVLRSRYPITEVVGHEQTKPTRRDPGPLLDIKYLNDVTRPTPLD